MSATITHKDPSKQSCGCNTQDIKPSKLDALIAKYERLVAELEAAKQKFIEAALSILDFRLEECSEEDIYAMFRDNDNTNT